MLQHSIFREYDIRGVIQRDLNPAILEQIGLATTTFLRRSLDLERPAVAVARDCRLSSPAYQSALIHGPISAGCQVFDVGMAPTPVLYFAHPTLDTDAAVVVTASHNPREYNELKLRSRQGPLFGRDLQTIYDLVCHRHDPRSDAGAVRTVDVSEHYLTTVAQRITLKRPLKLVLDAGNGVAGPLASELFRRLGCQVIELFTEPDGRFPNHIADPTVPRYMADLCNRVTEVGADLGIGLDGDGNRMGVVDETGTLWPGDRTLMLYSRSVLSNLPGRSVVIDVKCSQELVEDIRAHGEIPIMWKTGYPFIRQKLRESHAPLAGEMSGHIYFADNYFGYDDGIFAGARILEVLAATDKKLSELLPPSQRASTPELRLECPDQRKFGVVEFLQNAFKRTHDVEDIDGARVHFEDGWALIRASNTQPAIVARFEASSSERLSSIISDVQRILDTKSGWKFDLMREVERGGGEP